MSLTYILRINFKKSSTLTQFKRSGHSLRVNISLFISFLEFSHYPEDTLEIRIKPEIDAKKDVFRSDKRNQDNTGNTSQIVYRNTSQFKMKNKIKILYLKN